MVPEFHALVAGKRVAVVGNAQSLNSKAYGKEIDSHDVVIRMNHSGIFFIGDERFDNEKYDLQTSIGSKINVWTIWDIKNYINFINRPGGNASDAMPGAISTPKILNILNGTKGVKVNILDLALSGGKFHQGFHWIPKGRSSEYVNPLTQEEFFEEYEQKYSDEIEMKHNLWLNYRNPSTGLTLLKILNEFTKNIKRKNRDQIQSVNIYGFDFKETPTFSTPNEEIENTENGERFCYFKHDWMLEKNSILELCNENKRWNLIQ